MVYDVSKVVNLFAHTLGRWHSYQILLMKCVKQFENLVPEKKNNEKMTKCWQTKSGYYLAAPVDA